MPNLILGSQYTEGVIFDSDSHVNYNIIDEKRLIPPNVFLEFGKYDNDEFFRLRNFEDESTLAILKIKTVTFNNISYKQCSVAESIVRRKGYCSFLYKYVIRNNNIPIISDGFQSLPGSVDLWKYLRFAWRKKKVFIGYINLLNNRHYKWRRRTLDHNIWGIPEDYLLDVEESTPLEVLNDMKDHESISIELYDYLIKNLKYLKNRFHIRLIAFNI